MSCFNTIHVYSKQRNSDGSREAEEQEEHMLESTRLWYGESGT